MQAVQALKKILTETQFEKSTMEEELTRNDSGVTQRLSERKLAILKISFNIEAREMTMEGPRGGIWTTYGPLNWQKDATVSWLFSVISELKNCLPTDIRRRYLLHPCLRFSWQFSVLEAVLLVCGWNLVIIWLILRPLIFLNRLVLCRDTDIQTLLEINKRRR